MEEGEEGEKWSSNTQHPIIYGLNFESVHLKLRPIIFRYSNGIGEMDKGAVVSMRDIEYYMNSLRNQNEDMTITVQIADIITRSLVNHREYLNRIIGNS